MGESRRLLDDADGPEVVRQIVIEQVCIGHVEIARVTPCRAPRIAADEHRVFVVVSDRQHRVSAYDRFLRAWHGNIAGTGDFAGLEAFVDREAEYERVAGGEAPFMSARFRSTD